MSMLRSRKRKEPSLIDELKELDLLEEGDPDEIPVLENEDLIEENSMSVIVRGLNKQAHKVGALIKALPPIWGVEDSVRGRGVGEDRAQFHFENEGNLYHVLYRGPWFVNGWIIALDQWKPNPGPEFLNRILFWVRIKGIPVHLLKKQTVESIMGSLGKVEAVELHAKNSSSVEYVRARTWLKAEEPLQFLKRAIFKTGETTHLELTYEKLIKVCFICKRLTHEMGVCPFKIKELVKNSKQRRPQQLGTDLRKTKGKDTRGKGKGIRVYGQDTRDGDSGRSKQRSEEAQSPSKGAGSVQDRLQWANTGARSSALRSQQKWRVKENTVEVRSQGLASKSTEDSVSCPSKRRRSCGSMERLTKKARTGGSGEKLSSPSVFERLGSSGDRKKGEEGGSRSRHSSGSRYSSGKAKVSPSVFERLGSQASSSSPQEKITRSGHSAQLAARLSYHSAPLLAAQDSFLSGVKPAIKSLTIEKEGLMDNSNPSRYT